MEDSDAPGPHTAASPECLPSTLSDQLPASDLVFFVFFSASIAAGTHPAFFRESALRGYLEPGADLPGGPGWPIFAARCLPQPAFFSVDIEPAEFRSRWLISPAISAAATNVSRDACRQQRPVFPTTE